MLIITQANFEEKSPLAARKAATVRRAPSNVTAKQQPPISTTIKVADRGSKESNNCNGPVGVTAVTTITTGFRNCRETRDQEAQTPPHVEEAEITTGATSAKDKLTNDTLQALAITVQYFARQVDSFSDYYTLKKEYEKMKTEWLSAQTEVEELRARHITFEEAIESERDDFRKALERLRSDLEAEHVERTRTLETNHLEERRRLEAQMQESLAAAVREHQDALSRIEAEHEAELARREAETERRMAVRDQGALLAEAESLRTVLEIRSRENANLRSEVDLLRRELDDKESLEQRVESLEARCEDLKAQLQGKESFERQLSHDNEVLLESMHQVSKQNKRLSQRNEELLWRLRQKNEVVSVLANQLAAPPQRLSRSLGPEHMDHTITETKNNGQSPPHSMVKFMVEKGDSVSWTLEIDESLESLDGTTSPRRCSGVPPARQGSLRLSAPRRPALTPVRTRSKSVSMSEAREEQATWSPGFTSTPMRRRRKNESSPSPDAGATVPEEVRGPRPQEAGGEAMISEETSTSSSDDESSASSDIPRLTLGGYAWEKTVE